VRAQPVARLAGLAVADAVRQDDVVARCIQELARAEQNAAKSVGEKLRARAAGAVKHQHRVADDAALVALRLSQGCIVQLQLRKRLPALETKISNDEIALFRLWIICRVRRRANSEQCK